MVNQNSSGTDILTLPITHAVSPAILKASITEAASALLTISTAPIPQLKVLAISSTGTLP
jgi:hypothetical protein